jgi:hypothetical protein
MTAVFINLMSKSENEIEEHVHKIAQAPHCPCCVSETLQPGWWSFSFSFPQESEVTKIAAKV